MQKTDWAGVRKKLKKAIDEGMHLLKEGTDEARYVAGQTARVLQIEMEIHRIRTRISTLTYRLGGEAHRMMRSGRLQASAEIKKVDTEIADLEEMLKKKEGELRHTTIVRKGRGRKGG